MKKLTAFALAGLYAAFGIGTAHAQSVIGQPVVITPLRPGINFVVTCRSSVYYPGRCATGPSNASVIRYLTVAEWLKENGLKPHVNTVNTVVMPDGQPYLAIEVER